VCVCVFVCPRSYLRNFTSDLHHFLCVLPTDAARSSSGGRSDELCSSGFMDDVIFADKPKLLDVAVQPRRSAHTAVGLAINCAQ